MPSSIVEFYQRSRNSTPLRRGIAQRFRYPETETEWQSRYSWLFDSYTGAAYDTGDIEAFGLFTARDENNDSIAETRRLTRDVQHIVDTDTRALAGFRWSLDLVPGGGGGDLAVAESIWRRSRWQAKKAKHARDCCMMGDTMIEVGPTERGGPPVLVGHDPRFVALEYDASGLNLTRATIRIDYFEGDPGEPWADSVLRSYRRVLYPDRIETRELDANSGTAGRLIGELSGPHTLGVVPLVHVPFLELGEPEHGLWAGHAIEPVLAHIDSHLTQIRAIANRYANPILGIFGGHLAADSDIFKFGRVASFPASDMRAEYLEAGAEAIQGMWQVIKEYQDTVRHTIPEFMFAAGAGANTSGRALDLRADQFRLKMEEVRDRFYGAVSLATQYAHLLDLGQPYDPDERWYRILAPPVLPIDAGTRVNVTAQALQAGFLKRVDAVRQAQACGLLDETIDAAVYAAELDAEREARRPDFTPAADDDDDDEEDDDMDDGGEE